MQSAHLSRKFAPPVVQQQHITPIGPHVQSFSLNSGEYRTIKDRKKTKSSTDLPPKKKIMSRLAGSTLGLEGIKTQKATNHVASSVCSHDEYKRDLIIAPTMPQAQDTSSSFYKTNNEDLRSSSTS